MHQVFKESTNPEVISDVFRAVDQHMCNDHGEKEVGIASGRKVMECMSKIGGFRMMKMMMSGDDKERVARILSAIEASQGVDAVADLKAKYE